jgi:hypothetical protein
MCVSMVLELKEIGNIEVTCISYESKSLLSSRPKCLQWTKSFCDPTRHVPKEYGYINCYGVLEGVWLRTHVDFHYPMIQVSGIKT